MASPSQYISIGMGLDIQDLRQGLSDAKSAMSEADASFQNSVAGLGKWDSNVYGLTEKLVALSTEMEQKKRIVEAYREELERTVAEFGEGSKEARAMQSRLDKAEASYKKAEEYTGNLETKLEGLYEAESIATEDTEALRKKVALLKRQEGLLATEVGKTETELEQAKERFGDNSKQAQALTSKLKTQKTQLGYVESALGKYEDALESSNRDAKNATSYTNKFITSLKKVKSACNTAIKNGLDKLKEKLTDLGKNALGGIANAVVDFAKQTVQLGMDFTETMQEVKATAHASDEEMELLEKTAREFGATTTFSAVESAEALKYMALAGWTAEQSAEGLGGILSLASASGMDLADASDMVTDNLTAFGLQAKDSAHFADVLALAQSTANTSAEQLGEAYKNSAANLNASGQSMETVTAMLAVMSNAGTKGSEAGTALSAMTRDMTRRMKDGAIAIGDTTVAVMDSQGNFRNYINILRDVEKATAGMGDAEKQSALLKTFTANSISGLNLLLQQGTGEITRYFRAMKGADGTAQEMSDTMNDSLAGDMKSLNSALQDVQLRIYDCLEGPLRGIVQFITDAIPVLIDFAEDVYDFFVKVYDATKPIWDALAEFFGWVGEAIGKAGEIIGGAFETITETLGKIGSFFEGLGKDIVGFIKDPWGSTKSFFEDRYNEMKEAFKDPETAFKTIGNTAKNALEQTFNATPNNFKGKYDNILKAFDKAGIDFGKIGNDMKSGLEGAWNGISKWAGGVFGDITGAFSDPKKTLQDIGGKMWKSLQDGWTNIAGWAGGIFESIKGVFGDPKKTLQDVGGRLWKSLQDGWTNISGWASGILDTIKGVLRDPAGTMKSVGTSLWNGITSGISGVGSWASTSIVSPIQNAFNGLGSWASNTFGGIWTTISNVFSPIKGFFEDIYNGIMKVVSPILGFFGIKSEKADPLAQAKADIAKAEEDLKVAKKTYDDAFSAWMTAKNTYGRNSWQEESAYSYYTGVYSTYNQQRAYVQSLKDGLEEMKSQAETDGLGGIKNAISNAFSGVKDLILSPFTEAWNGITGLFGGIGSWFDENVIKPLQKALNPVGEAVSSGVVGGMTDAKKSITTGTQTIADWIVGSVCKALGVNSPSKVMHDKVGLMIGAGIALGIEDSTRDAVRATARLGEAVSDGLRLDSAVGSPSSARGVPSTIVYNQTINSPDPLSAGQIYRDTRSLIGRRTWA